jgi:hypothetical protein
MTMGLAEGAGNRVFDDVDRLLAREGHGWPLPDDARADMGRLFGGADLGAVRLHRDSATAAALGFAGFACGNDVFVAPGAPDLGTQAGRGLLAHELTHVFQQAAGRVGLPAAGRRRRGVIVADPALEAEADLMAELAAAGGLAPPGILRFARSNGQVCSPLVLQPKVQVDSFRADRPATFDEMNAALTDNNNPGGMYISTAGLTPMQKTGLFDLLHDWAGRPRKPIRPRKSLDLVFRDWMELAQALVGHVRSKTNKAYETALAREVLKSGYIKTKLTAAVLKLKNYIDGLKAHKTDPRAAAILDTLKEVKGRYGTYYGRKWVLTKLGQKSVYDALYDLANGDKPVGKLASFLADFSYVHQKTAVKPDTKNFFDKSTQKGKEFDEGRGETYWGIDEGSKWAQDVRAHDEPVGAGPSATTALTLGTIEGLANRSLINSIDHSSILEAVAWGLFAFWNSVEHDTLWAWKASIHTFHEVMWVAADYGVPYQLHKYPNEIPPNIEGWY